MKSGLVKALRRIQGFIDRPWYTLLLGGLCAADLVLQVVPMDPLLVTTCVLRPRRWSRVWLSMTAGSIVGTLVMASFLESPAAVHFREHHLSHFLHTHAWHRSEVVLQKWGVAGLVLLGASPLPQLIPILVAVLGGIAAPVIALALGAGRLLKYGTYSWAAAHAPHWLAKVPGLRGEIEAITGEKR